MSGGAGEGTGTSADAEPGATPRKHDEPGRRRAPGVDAILVAAGESRRMGRDKLSLALAGRPLLRWSLDALLAAPEVERIVVVTAPARLATLAEAAWPSPRVVAVVAGGDRRQASVAAGLRALAELDAASATAADQGRERVVLVHDGARPLATAGLVSRVAAAAAAHGAAIPVLPVTETVKRIDADGTVAGTVDRSTLATAQTPQAARRALLESAFARFPADGPATFTDEAALLEACRITVHAIPGEPTNLKVTVPDDVARAEATLLGRARPRVGLGSDRHPFGPGEPLALGGLAFPGAPRLHGHSDGDVALHALADALLGAAGLGDLGRLFPAGPATPRGVASRELLAEVVRRVLAAGLRPASVDLVIVGARPRLAGRLEEMSAVIAELLGLPADRVNVKASTGNLAGPEGAGRGLAAQAIVLLEAGA